MRRASRTANILIHPSSSKAMRTRLVEGNAEELGSRIRLVASVIANDQWSIVNVTVCFKTCSHD